MCTSLITYDTDDKVLTCIEVVPRATVANLPFLATRCKNMLRGQYLKACETTHSYRLTPSSKKICKKPDGYTEYTHDAYRKRLEEEAKARQK